MVCGVFYLPGRAAVKKIPLRIQKDLPGTAILRFTNPQVRPKVISFLVFIALSNLRHRSRPNGGRGMEMRHGARRRGVTIAE
jgi:hypothetical protein